LGRSEAAPLADHDQGEVRSGHRPVRRGRTPGTSGQEFTFTGEQVDATGLQYLRARYYDAATGRFASRDPLPFAQRYAYVGGNPVNYVDPGGTDDGKPEAVPLPAAGTDDLFLRCQMGRSECRDRIAPQQQRRRGGPLQIYRDVCHDFFTMCVRHANRGDPDTYFDFDGARQRMGALSVIDSGSRSWLSTLMQTVESIKNIRLRMPRLPNTGSGGYLTQRHPKEGGFGCSP